MIININAPDFFKGVLSPSLSFYFIYCLSSTVEVQDSEIDTETHNKFQSLLPCFVNALLKCHSLIHASIVFTLSLSSVFFLTLTLKRPGSPLKAPFELAHRSDTQTREPKNDSKRNKNERERNSEKTQTTPEITMRFTIEICIQK